MKDNTFIKLSTLCLPNNNEVDRKAAERCLVDEYCKSFPDAVSCENAISELFDFCSDRTELFVPAQKEDCFKFFHRTFFEYFYSLHISLEIQDTAQIYEHFITFDVDSEIYELTLSAFKQRRHSKYVEITEFLFNTVEKELVHPSFTAFNILTILVAQVITEPPYQERYLRLLTAHSDTIATSLNKRDGAKITDLNNSIFRSEKESVSCILKSYSKYIKRDLLVLFSVINSELFEKFSADMATDSSFHPHDLFQPPYSIVRGNTLGPIGFYTILLLKTNETLVVLDELAPVVKGTIKDAVSQYGITRNQVKQCRANLLLYFHFDKQKKDIFCRYLRDIIRVFNYLIM